MSRRIAGASRRSLRRRKAYQAPKLKVHGHLGELTRRKKGTRADGAGKPRTRASGANA